MKKIFLLILFCFSTLILIYYISLYNVLTVQGDRNVQQMLIKDGTIVTLKFVHSVELFDYIEVYEVYDGNLILKKAMSKSFGWGLPYYGNLTFEDYYIVYRFNKSFRSFYVSTYDFNNYTLRVDNKTLKLDNFGTLVKLRVDDLWQWIFQRLKESLPMKEDCLDGKQS
ncbi:DUF1850 domain-containing protein [Archaeoglobus profundus]|uniref:DUF1850 domain-containing protein n=1 Tax=Archaeoglobus profundus (strain DSM 5631 / JCM 9629 / NBRC 100127 / Av18) TaxID=572546 RepID=D2RE23_ARCPA|nr:DUF1850 domain-containing protein [Archaeoglobus profundus]ADB58367.1 Domain of unknown function DUF1850 [Archaeoglobus profundus DSM 5631]